MASNKVKFGLSNCYYAILDPETKEYGTPVKVPGAVTLTMDPQGESSTFYADNIAYYTTNANNGYSGDWELAMVTDQMRQDLWGDELDDTAKVLIENAEKEPKTFALLFQIQGDQHARRAVLYNCTAARPGTGSATTTETKDPQTDTCALTALPLESGIVKAVTTDETPTNVYDAWFTSVWEQ